jgi:hypothetical protein
MKSFLCLWISAVCVIVFSRPNILLAAEKSIFQIDTNKYNWRFLAGPELENQGKANIQLIKGDTTGLKLELYKKRGHVMREFSPTSLPLEITFNWKSKYDVSSSEPAHEFWGTGDFRISIVGFPKGFVHQPIDENILGMLEGVQYRIFPHLGDSPIRRTTPNSDGSTESHTSTSIWTRFSNAKRLTGDNGEPHTGLQSDACQNRNSANATHNCGWNRRALLEGGLGLINNDNKLMKIYISKEETYLECNGRRFFLTLNPEDIRFDKLSGIVIGATNTSRGFQELEISNFKVISLLSTNINEEKKIEGISVFPNPAKNTLNINNLKYIKRLEIISNDGRQLIQLKIIDEEMEVDLSSLPSGVYFLKVTLENNYQALKKFIKQ